MIENQVEKKIDITWTSGMISGFKVWDLGKGGKLRFGSLCFDRHKTIRGASLALSC